MRSLYSGHAFLALLEQHQRLLNLACTSQAGSCVHGRMQVLQAVCLACRSERMASLVLQLVCFGKTAAAVQAEGQVVPAIVQRRIAVLRAGVATHGLSNALPHFRLNASQIHNAVRRVIDLEGEPTDAARRRSHLATIHTLLNDVRPVAVDFGALAAERASAARLMMTIAQILKHVDGTHPVRFLIAETETGYTLLAALWLARHYGIADKLEITPLFEPASARISP